MNTDMIIVIAMFLMSLVLSGGMGWELYHLDKKHNVLVRRYQDLVIRKNWFQSEMEKRIEFIQNTGLWPLWRERNPILELVANPVTAGEPWPPAAQVIHLPDGSATHTVVAPELQRIVNEATEEEALAFLHALRQRVEGKAAPIAA